MAPTWAPRWSPNRTKIDAKNRCVLDLHVGRFFCYFGSILGPKLRPCWPHFPSKSCPTVVRRPPFCWVYVIFRFFGRPGPLLAQFGLDFGRFGHPFWKFLKSILEVYGHDLGPTWLVIWYFFKLFFFVILDPSWQTFGSKLEGLGIYFGIF